MSLFSFVSLHGGDTFRATPAVCRNPFFFQNSFFSTELDPSASSAERESSFDLTSLSAWAGLDWGLGHHGGGRCPRCQFRLPASSRRNLERVPRESTTSRESLQRRETRPPLGRTSPSGRRMPPRGCPL